MWTIPKILPLKPLEKIVHSPETYLHYVSEKEITLPTLKAAVFLKDNLPWSQSCFFLGGHMSDVWTSEPSRPQTERVSRLRRTFVTLQSFNVPACHATLVHLHWRFFQLILSLTTILSLNLDPPCFPSSELGSLLSRRCWISQIISIFTEIKAQTALRHWLLTGALKSPKGLTRVRC